MYRTVECFSSPNLMRPYSENFSFPNHRVKKQIIVQPQPLSPPARASPPKKTEENFSQKLTLEWKVRDYDNISDTNVWGPAKWFCLHTSAVYYPLNPSPIIKNRMKARILSIPYELPCAVCQTHASAFVEGNKEKLDDIVSSREKLFNFYVEFHNAVNRRLGKPEMTYKNAWKLYTGKVEVRTLSYQ